METSLTWVLAAMSVTGVILNIKRVKWCFVIWVCANLGWVAVNIVHGIYAQAALFTVYTGLSIWGFIEWTKNPPKSGECTPSGQGGS